MTNINKLKSVIVEKGYSVNSFAAILSFDKSTFYRKINNNGISLTIGEVDEIAKKLNLSYDEVMLIFFAQYVA